MASDEFKEIRECWAELKTCFDEIDALNAQETRGKFDSYAAPTATAR